MEQRAHGSSKGETGGIDRHADQMIDPVLLRLRRGDAEFLEHVVRDGVQPAVAVTAEVGEAEPRTKFPFEPEEPGDLVLEFEPSGARMNKSPPSDLRPITRRLRAAALSITALSLK